MLALLPVNLVFLAVVFGYWANLTQDQLRQQSERQASSLVSQLTILSAQALASHNEWVLPEQVERFSGLRGIDYAYLVDSQGRVIADARGERVGSQEVGNFASGDETVLRYLKRKGNQSPQALGGSWNPLAPQFGDFDVLEVTAPLLLGGRRFGAARIGLDLGLAQRQLAGSYSALWAASALLTLLGLGLLAWISRGFSRPILHVAEKAEKLAESWELGPSQSRGEGQSEVGLLSRALDQMAASLRALNQRQRDLKAKLQHRVGVLRSAAERVAEGDLSAKVEVQGQGEIGRLEDGFNRMVGRLIKTRQAELQARLDLEWTREALVQGNRRLAELDRRKTDFLNTASHELRTPLTSIRAFAEIVLDNQEEVECSSEEFLEENREFLEIIHRESERLTRLLHSLLDLSNIEAGKIDWEFELLSVEELVTSTVNCCRSLMQEKSMQLSVIHDVPGLTLSGARDPLIQVLTNLLSNAIKFTAAGGRIEIRSRRGQDQVIIEVEDSGVGIAPEDQSKVFESFQQAEGQPDTGAPKGSGLGLAIVKQIVETHGGTIKLQSILGKGSCFIVRLPAQELGEDSQNPTP